MKQFLLLAAAGAVAMAASAQRTMEDEYVPNLLVNGDFEDAAYVQDIIGSFTWDFYDHTAADGADPWMALSELPGWCNIGNSTWMGWCYIGQEEGDDYLRPEDDLNYLRLQSYKDNGWTDHFTMVGQAVSGVTIGKTYTFDFVAMMAISLTGSWDPWGTPGFGYAVYELDTTKSEPTAGKLIKDTFTSDSDYDWGEYGVDFVATAADLYVEFYLSLPWGEGNDHDNMYVMVDRARLYDKEEAQYNKDNGIVVNGISSVVSDNNAPVTYYNLQGMSVANPTQGQVYIRKQGNTSKKVIF
ncbi:MAG: hypothetical protein LIP03_16320 [Bacteroidales bacterium]|nr:hypothetical protein [Bacteroidales bacterium]